MLLGRILSGEVQPVQALETPPMLVEIACQHTISNLPKGFTMMSESVTWPGLSRPALPWASTMPMFRNRRGIRRRGESRW